MSKQKYYVVLKGRKTGVFNSWKECEEQVKGYSNAKFFSSFDITKAREMFSSAHFEHLNNNDNNIQKPTHGIAIDGSCLGNPGIGEYQAIDILSNELIFRHSNYLNTTNNIMEFFALIDIMKYIKKNSLSIPIYTDSITSLSWVKKKKVKTNLIQNNDNTDSFLQIEKSIKFLNSININEFNIYKWNTNLWGEIPADFGRK